MCEDWMPRLSIALTHEQYERLPRNPAYQYDYVHGQAVVSPRPKYFHGVLTFANWQTPRAEEIDSRVGIHPLPEERAELAEVFAGSFERVQPFGGLAWDERVQAARRALEKTWRGGDGPWLSEASFSAVDKSTHAPLGAILITLVPGGDPGQAESYCWEGPLADLTGRRGGQPHLTWIFVAPRWKTSGVGSALLDRAVGALTGQGHVSLWSTFLLGNDSSMLWHWRNGFTLAPLPTSRRGLRLNSST